MQHTLTSCPPERAHFDSNPTFNVVIAYEDFQTGKHAKRTYDFLVEHLGCDCHFSNQMWKFEVLSIPKLREIAAKDVELADIVVVSCHGDELPPHVKAWIESWLMQGCRPLALVALFDAPSENHARTGPTRAYLASIAKRGNMEFFAQPDQWPGRLQAESATEPRVDSRFEKTLSTLAGVVQRDIPASRWEVFD